MKENFKVTAFSKRERTLRHSTLSTVVGLALFGTAFFTTQVQAELSCNYQSDIPWQCSFQGDAIGETVTGTQHYWFYAKNPETNKTGLIKDSTVRDRGMLVATHRWGIVTPLANNGEWILPGMPNPGASLVNTNVFDEGVVQVVASATAHSINLYDRAQLIAGHTDFYPESPIVTDVKLHDNSTAILYGGDVADIVMNDNAQFTATGELLGNIYKMLPPFAGEWIYNVRGSIHNTVMNDNSTLYLQRGAMARGVTQMNDNSTLYWKWSPLNWGQSAIDDLQMTSRGAVLFIDSTSTIVPTLVSRYIPMVLPGQRASVVMGNLFNNGTVEFASIPERITPQEFYLEGGPITGMLRFVDASVNAIPVMKIFNNTLVDNAIAIVNGFVTGALPPGQIFTNLVVNNLAGNGTFIFRTNVVEQISDKLIVQGESKGIHRVEIKNYGSAQTTGREIVKLIETADGGASFALPNMVELGAYVYDLRKVDTNWELYSPGQAGFFDKAGRASFGSVSALSAAASASTNTLNVRYLMNEAENQAMLNRVSELRHTSGHLMNLWAKTYYGKFKSFSDEVMNGFNMVYGGVQIGGDVQLLRGNTSDRLYTGLFVGYGSSSQDYGTEDLTSYLNGKGTMKSYSAGIYGTYIRPQGFYIDGAFKYSRYKNEYTVKDTAHETVIGKGNSNGYSATVEVGNRFFFNAKKDGFYVEPQFQLTYTLHTDAEITNSNGLITELDNYHSLVTRLGALLGYEVKLSQTPVNFYIKNSWLREYDGTANYTFNKFDVNELDYNFKGNAWQVGVGVTAQFNKVHAVYLDMENTSAKKYNHHRVNAGYRYSF